MASGDNGQRQVRLALNGDRVELSARTDETLLRSLRSVGLTSVREACGIGICGSCTVLVDGKAVSSCLMLTALCSGKDVVTSEGLVAKDGTLDDVQQAFLDKRAFQCSYCIPGMVMAVRALLDGVEPGSSVESLDYLSGNLCRCGSYPQVIQAVYALLEERGIDVPSE